MKRVHFVLLAVTIATVIFSAYSLAAINQIYKINFEWYSQYDGAYKNEFRDTQDDKWFLQEYPGSMEFIIMQDNYTSESKFIMLYCTLGSVNSPEYRVKITDIAQRGGVVEIKVSVNSPSKLKENVKPEEPVYYPEDNIRINRAAFPVRGKLLFIFKNQNGKKLLERYFDVK